ncbi:hypothetical protein Dda_1214 [Drechslerella dactyloides]|uniref:NAD(P)-binding domain-containing protein n=1 Tax=Drechslerella dactyloides TaxID=74499 RepID=A0AAD6NN92_DREDA|nr:hypothetical protein Dda_1214 [Drechslerella dactyloides]
MSQPSKTVAFFGATGGCAVTTLEHSLRAGYRCSVLVRSSEKLKGLLPTTVPTTNLRIVQGDGLNPDDVRATLVDPSTNAVVDTIIYGLGMRPTTNNPLTFKFPTPTLCEDTTRLIMDTIADLKPTRPPFALFISTTGIKNTNDVPLLFQPFYHWALKTPHLDKGIMEDLVIEAAIKGVLRNYMIVRPSLLTDGEATYGNIRVGHEESTKDSVKGELTLAEGGCGWTIVDGPAIGYTISRKDVGAFVFEEGVRNGGEKFKGQKVRLTY